MDAVKSTERIQKGSRTMNIIPTEKKNFTKLHDTNQVSRSEQLEYTLIGEEIYIEAGNDGYPSRRALRAMDDFFDNYLWICTDEKGELYAVWFGFDAKGMIPLVWQRCKRNTVGD